MHSLRSNLIFRLLLTSMLLRIAVPTGFMPAALEDGWYLKVCPDGLSMQTMMAVFGHQHAHHGDEDEQFVQCDLGGGLGALAVLADVQGLPVLAVPPLASPPVDVFLSAASREYNQRPRAPPLSRLI